MQYVLRLGMKVWSDHVTHIKFDIAICDRAWEKGPCRANNDFSV